MLEALTIAIAILLGFTVQTTAGFAGGLISVPILLLVTPLAEAVAIASVYNFAFSAVQVSRNKQYIKLATYKELALGTLIGVPLGAVVLSFGNPTILKRGLGIFILAYIAYRYSKKNRLELPKHSGHIFSFVGGFFAGLFSSGAPPYVIYLTNKFEEPKELRANLIGILAICNVLRPIALIFTGVFTATLFVKSLWGVPAFLIALWFGEKIFGRIPKHLFLHVVMVFLAASGLMILLR